TSGSMERRIDEPNQPTDRLPSCTSNSVTDQRNRWAIALEALTGTFNTFRCKSDDRSSVEYQGRFDYGYFIPHANFDVAFDTQTSNGILDTYVDRAKFGLMTFDGVTTTISGKTLVPYDDYPGASNSVADVMNGVEGMFSWPTAKAAISMSAGTSSQFGWKPLAFPGCGAMYGVNAGARGPDASADASNLFVSDFLQPDGLDSKTSPRAGALISVGNSESATAIAVTNGRIQASLRFTRPYGGTPIAAMLDDFRDYLRSHNDVKKGSDPFYMCRKRFGLLITDGAPDSLYRDSRFQCANTTDATCPLVAGTPRCQCPYDTEENIASRLVTSDGLERLWVVAFNVDNTALTSLNRIAQAGSPAGAPRDALTANSSTELNAALAEVMNLARPESTSRSVPVVVNTGRPVTLKGGQYVISAGFQVGTKETDPWQGRLFRQRVECDGTVATAKELAASERDLFHLTLNNRQPDDRTIKTVALTDFTKRTGNLFAASTDPGLIPSTSTSNAIKALVTTLLTTLGVTDLLNLLFSLGETLTAETTEYGSTLVDFGKQLSRNNFPVATDALRDTIIDYTRGVPTNRAGAKLADIYHSNPAVLPPLALGSDYLNTFDPTLRAYYLNLVTRSDSSRYGAAGRPGVVFVGTNDGVLHAFNLETWVDKAGVTYEAGYEFWGFVPPALFEAMRNPTPGLRLFDGSPVVKDVIYSRTRGAGTVLVSALRSVPGYIAMDVTNPETPKFLWQRRFKGLGNTLATPAIAHVSLSLSGGTKETRAVAILPGGQGTPNGSASTGCNVDEYGRGAVPNGGRTKVTCWKTLGRSLYVVDALTGALIQEFDFRHFPSPMTGSVVVDGEDLGLTRAAYMTDEDGVLWRLSMMNSDPTKWRVAPIWDLFAGTLPGWDGTAKSVGTTPAVAGRVATYPPLLVRDPKTANLTIVVGTGNIDALTDPRPNRVVSLREVRQLDSSDELIETDAKRGITLNWGLQLDAYESVTGPISVLDDVAYFTTFTGPSDASQCLVGGARIVGAHVRTKVTDGRPLGQLQPESGSEKVLSYRPTAAPDALLLGLNVSPDPVCVQGQTTSDPLASGALLRVDNITKASRGSYQLRTMVAGQGGSILAGSNAGGAGAQKQLSRTIATPNVARSVGWASSIE
ncbi:MAG: hypothetical protein ABW352_10835, partial [Polyangiales bacterium]